jgi:biotin carboxyl carrier protein
MKMENEILAERGGTVKAIHVAAGDPVENGDKLVTLE